jgi:chromosome segregation ATPase
VRRNQWTELQALRQQVGELSRRVHDSEARASELAEEKHSVERSVESARSATQALVGSQDGLRWELGQAKGEVHALSARLQALQEVS